MQQAFMREAIRIAMENAVSGRGGPFGCVVVKDGRIIATGANEVTGTNDPTAHAEVVAIRRACQALGSFQLEGCEVYCSCEPCPMCLGALYWARPTAVYFAATKEDAATIGFDDHFIYAELERPITARERPMQQLMRAEALAAFEHWRTNPDKVPY
ncbi:MAG: nucleoside deaminase [Flavobacteriales bacterium]